MSGWSKSYLADKYPKVIVVPLLVMDVNTGKLHETHPIPFYVFPGWDDNEYGCAIGNVDLRYMQAQLGGPQE